MVSAMVCPSCGRECQNAKLCPECGREQNVPSKPDGSMEKVSCPQCGSFSVNAVVERRLVNEYRYYRSIAAMLLTFLDRLVQRADEERYGPECVCLQCGYRWNEKRRMLARKYEGCLSKILRGDSPLVVPTADGCVLNLDSQSVTVCKNKKHKQGIPYEQIIQVYYQKSLGPLYGWLSIRHEGNRKKPFPVTFEQAKKDKMTFLCPFSYEGAYLEIYSVLKEIVQVNKKAGLHEG